MSSGICIILLSAASIQGFLLRQDVCYHGLGCFNNGPPFFSRHLSLLPQNPALIDTKYYLYTRINTKQKTVISPTSTASSDFNGSRATKFIIHGFTQSSDRAWVHSMAIELLKNQDLNVIVVDWKKGAQAPFQQAASNTRVVGAEVAVFIQNFESATSLSRTKVHIIGHGLGAHIAGYAGERLKGLARITGLDPDGPYFESTDDKVRLDATDAVFVDVIHTNDPAENYMGIGIRQPVGHVDFYPNGGSKQPGCGGGGFLSNIVGNVWNALTLQQYGTQAADSCEHMFSIRVFTESINAPCPFKAFACPNEAEMKAGKCLHCVTGHCSVMGYHADSVKAFGTMYLVTEPDPPYCSKMFQVNITTGADIDGVVKLTIHGTHADSIKLTFLDGILKKGQTHAANFNTRMDFGEIRGVSVEYVKTSNLLTAWLYPDAVKLVAVAVFSSTDQKEILFCAYGKVMQSTGPGVLVPTLDAC